MLIASSMDLNLPTELHENHFITFQEILLTIIPTDKPDFHQHIHFLHVYCIFSMPMILEENLIRAPKADNCTKAALPCSLSQCCTQVVAIWTVVFEQSAKLHLGSSWPHWKVLPQEQRQHLWPSDWLWILVVMVEMQASYLTTSSSSFVYRNQKGLAERYCRELIKGSLCWSDVFWMMEVN